MNVLGKVRRLHYRDGLSLSVSGLKTILSGHLSSLNQRPLWPSSSGSITLRYDCSAQKPAGGSPRRRTPLQGRVRL